jgi:GDP-L-fucose synthase
MNEEKMITKNSKVFIAGHQGMVGSAILRKLQKENYKNIVVRARRDLDLTNQQAVKQFIQFEQPECVILAAAKVGGINANNTYPADFIYTNLMIECNVIHQSFIAGVQKLVFLGSSCIYPKLAAQPIAETALLTGQLEPTNEPYAIAKIAGIKLCESYNRQYGTDYRSIMPCNLYGPNDNYLVELSHVVPALIKKIHHAKINSQPKVEVWGTGRALREFLHVDDFASACHHILEIPNRLYQNLVEPMCSHINVGYGEDISIRNLALIICDVVGYDGMLEFNTSKPDGAPQKLMDNKLIRAMGWSPQYNLREGLAQTYQWYLENEAVACV